MRLNINPFIKSLEDGCHETVCPAQFELPADDPGLEALCHIGTTANVMRHAASDNKLPKNPGQFTARFVRALVQHHNCTVPRTALGIANTDQLLEVISSSRARAERPARTAS